MNICADISVCTYIHTFLQEAVLSFKRFKSRPAHESGFSFSFFFFLSLLLLFRFFLLFLWDIEFVPKSNIAHMIRRPTNEVFEFIENVVGKEFLLLFLLFLFLRWGIFFLLLFFGMILLNFFIRFDFSMTSSLDSAQNII